MTTYNLQQLLGEKTTDEYMDGFLTRLQETGFGGTSWDAFAIPRTMIELFAISLADQSTLISNITKSGLLSQSTEDWLSLLASELFSIERRAAVSAEYDVLLTETAGSPQSISVGALWLGTTAGLRYQNTTGGTLEALSTLLIRVCAESPGSQYNVPANSITIWHTPIPGVTSTNTSGTPAVAGADAETDESIRQRCQDKWSTTSCGGTDAAYRFWAMEADSSVTKVKVRANSVGIAGNVGVTISGDSAGVDSVVVATVQGALSARAPLCVTVIVQSATIQTVPITATAYVYSGYGSTYTASVDQALSEMFAALDIGEQLDDSQIIAAMMSPSGSRNVELSTPSGTIVPDDTTLLVKGTLSLSIVEL